MMKNFCIIWFLNIRKNLQRLDIIRYSTDMEMRSAVFMGMIRTTSQRWLQSRQTLTRTTDGALTRNIHRARRTESYVDAKSPANLIDSWMVGWKAVVDAGTDYIMTNNNVGITDGVQGYMDPATYSILRDDLGYDGVICLDWPLDLSSIMGFTGVNSEGVDISTLSEVERYALILNTGIDMFSCTESLKVLTLNLTRKKSCAVPTRI